MEETQAIYSLLMNENGTPILPYVDPTLSKDQYTSLDFPDHSQTESKLMDTVYTADKDGWIHCRATCEVDASITVQSSIMHVALIIDNVAVWDCGIGLSYNGSGTVVSNSITNDGFVRIYKGQQYKFSHIQRLGVYRLNNSAFQFIPVKE